jgi:hypothetical protein
VRKISLIVAFFAIGAFGAGNSPLDPQNFVPMTQEQIQIQQQQGGNQNFSDLLINNSYLQMDKDDINRVRGKNQEIREAFDGFSEKEINYKPVIHPIASMDVITLHPYFTSSMLLPSGSVISHIDSSTEMANLKFDSNVVFIRPKADFVVANITILYKLNDRNQILNILARRYEKREDEKLNLLISYEDKRKLEDLEVIDAYVREYKSYPTNKYSYITIDGIAYRIVEDKDYGTAFIKDKVYRIDNNVIRK